MFNKLHATENSNFRSCISSIRLNRKIDSVVKSIESNTNHQNIIFLDIDGVLNTQYSLESGVRLVNEKCKIITDLCVKTRSRLVIISSWLSMYKTPILVDILSISGIPSSFFHPVCEISDDDSLENSIKYWIKQQDLKTKYIIISPDMDSFDSLRDKVVKTEFKMGITFDNVRQARKLLTGV